MNPNNLWRTRTYLVGNMEYVSGNAGETWRDAISKELLELGVIIFNPYHKPFLKDVDEGNCSMTQSLSQRANGDFDELQEKMREIRAFDLNLVDRSDFIIAHINPEVASWGSAEELVTANRMKKPIFLSIEGGIKKCPLWIFGMIPYKYIYSSPSEIVEILKRIDSGDKVCDSSRWRLLRKEYR